MNAAVRLHARRLFDRWTAWGSAMFVRAMEDNLAQMAKVVGAEVGTSSARLLDLGCWDAETTFQYAPLSSSLFGVEGSIQAAKEALQRGVAVVSADLNKELPWPDDTFDAVTSNQVIEHLHDTDSFVRECARVVRPGGLVVISTENLASWHNILALTLGWQAFSLTPVSQAKAALGNPLANLRGADGEVMHGWEHLRIFSYRGLIELLEAHGLHDVTILASGYYPLPTRVAHVDRRHGALITAVGRKL